MWSRWSYRRILQTSMTRVKRFEFFQLVRHNLDSGALQRRLSTLVEIRQVSAQRRKVPFVR